MVNYKQGKIYKIECNITGLVYIGSTCKKKLSGRMSEHRSDYRKHMKGKKKYLSSFKVMENNDYNIILIEDFPCKSKDQLFARERYYTNTIECVNIRKNQGCILEIGKKESNKLYWGLHCDDKKDDKKLYDEEYYHKNIDKINSRTKENYETNKDKVKACQKNYREENKEKLSASCNCNCGGKYIYANRSQHLKTKRHQKYQEEHTED